MLSYRHIEGDGFESATSRDARLRGDRWMIALLSPRLWPPLPPAGKLTRVVDYEPAVSPDGKRLAFISNRDGRFKLHVMNLDGPGLRRLTDDAGADDNPAWSPDGARIAFVSEAGGEADIFVVAADGLGPAAADDGARPGPSSRVVAGRAAAFVQLHAR